MQKILLWFGYDIYDVNATKNKKINNLDYVLCIIYAFISLINAIWGMDSLSLVKLNNDAEFRITQDSLKALFLMIINGIILVRMNLKLYIECKDKEFMASNKLNERQRQCAIIKIKAIDKRMQLIYYCYIIDLIILIMNTMYSGINSSLATLIFIPIIITLVNNFIDIAKNKYNAEEHISYELNSLDGLK